MRLQFLGAAGTVTGSKYLIDVDSKRLLVDCGLFQGFKQLRLRNWSKFPVAPSSVDAIVLTHAHIDHSGYVPILVKNGFRGPIYCSDATADLCRILWPDSGRLMEEDAERANRRGYTKHHPALPLFTEDDAKRAFQLLTPRSFDDPFTAARRFKVTLVPAGHILGASIVKVTAEDRNLVFSGDLGRPNDPIMIAPALVDEADYLIVESTYGDRRHPESDPEEQLGKILEKTIARQGVVVIPAFAVGRTQSLLYCIHRLKESGRIPKTLPVYLNSPMGTDTTSLYEKYRTQHRLSISECDAMCHAARIVDSVEESKALNRMGGPMVIIAGSGMATGGRVVHHLKAFAPDPRNAIVLAGFQAGGTRGEKIQGGAASVRIHGEDVPIRAQVVSISNLSAHADYVEVLDWLGNFKRPPLKTFITHGEPTAADALRLRIQERFAWDTRVPDYLESVEL
jgi:metallo-beta-lactamase family protein